MDSFIRAVQFASRVTGVTAAFLIGAAVLVICDIVVERYLLNLTTIWQIDVVTYCIVGATFIGSPYVLMTRGHVNVDILPLHFGPRARYVLALVTMLLALAFWSWLWGPMGGFLSSPLLIVALILKEHLMPVESPQLQED